jgi:zinc protease
MPTNAIHTHTLPNNLMVITREVHSAPVATSWIWYRVGSRNEPSGCTGISHWVEHMLFKGTSTMPVGTLDRLVARNGGVFNGFTWVDYTAYFETLPSDRIELALQIESDRMINSTFDPEEVEHERTVILAEMEGYANYPETWLDEAVKAASFTVHPYHHPIIGYRSDIEAITRDDLYHHYQTYYMPNNAVLVLVGDFETSKMIQTAERYFGDLPVGPPLPSFHAVEPEPQGERRVMINRPGPAEYVLISYLVPDCRSEDFAPMAVLDAILSGAKSLTFMGRETQTSLSARLYNALVETGLASSVGSSFNASHDPYLLEMYATVQSDYTAADVEAALLHEVEKIQQEGISADELNRMIKQVRAQIAYGSESVTNQALLLGMWEVLDTYRRAETLLDEFTEVRLEDVQRVAQTYLTARRRTVGHFIPTNEQGV